MLQALSSLFSDPNPHSIEDYDYETVPEWALEKGLELAEGRCCPGQVLRPLLIQRPDGIYSTLQAAIEQARDFPQDGRYIQIIPATASYVDRKIHSTQHPALQSLSIRDLLAFIEFTAIDSSCEHKPLASDRITRISNVAAYALVHKNFNIVPTHLRIIHGTADRAGWIDCEFNFLARNTLHQIEFQGDMESVSEYHRGKHL